MSLFLFALLFSFYFLGSANQVGADKVDCDDQTVFDAANKVLQSLNNAKEEGNQFALYRITEASKKEETGSTGVQVFISFEMQESVCEVKSGIHWQRCAFKDNGADFGHCAAHVLVNTETYAEEIISQNCSTKKGWQPKAPKQPVLEPPVMFVRSHCLGCVQVIDTNSEVLLSIIQSAIEKMNTVGNHKFHFHLENVTKAQRQVVSGWNYKLEYTIRQTNCSKSLFPKWTPEECSLDKNGQDGNCVTDVFVTPNEEIKDIQLNCHSSTGFCLNCPDQVEASDPELLNVLKQFIKEYNSDSNHTNLYKLQAVKTASMKLVQNTKQYKATFGIQNTNCSKSDLTIHGEECDPDPLGDMLDCTANINVTDERLDILPDYKCDKSLSLLTVARGTVIKGLSPFRMMPSLGIMVHKRSLPAPVLSKRKGNEPDHKEQKLGKEPKKDKKGKEDKKHHGQLKDSSEESAEEHKPEILPQPSQHIPPRPPHHIPPIPPHHIPPRPPHHIPPIPPHHIPWVPEVDTSMVVTTTQNTKPTNADKVVGPPSTQLPFLLQSSPLTPAVRNHQSAFPIIHESGLPALAHENAPKCPGKLWQPLVPTIQIPTEKPFVIGGLVFNDDDLLPKSEEQILTPHKAHEFTDFDLDF
ncbi:T-kininogen 2-like [Dendropsophus ebraccatus]|uniref:T-kininogen 2-like n=1 Tax=Dendropsophus ebraccatus TaxID=150705 RepID=UPI0038320757